jgi:hypothetical protein
MGDTPGVERLDYDTLTALLLAAGWTRIGHDFERKRPLPCDCPEGTSWDPHYTCARCGSYDSHAIHGADARAWRAPQSGEVEASND